MNTDTDQETDPYDFVRAIGALLAIITLLVLTVLSFDRTGAPLAEETVYRLAFLIGVLLGLDRVIEGYLR